MTLAQLLSELREVHGNPDLKIHITWDGGQQWSASIPGYIVVDASVKSITSSMAQGESLRDVLEKIAGQMKGRVLQIQNDKDAKPFPVPDKLVVGQIDIEPADAGADTGAAKADASK